jgi:hypothetical protein
LRSGPGSRALATYDGSVADGPVRIVIGDHALLGYLGGGHWTWFLQYLLGLVELGHDVTCLALQQTGEDETADNVRVDSFFERMREFGLDRHCVVARYRTDQGEVPDHAELFGRSRAETRAAIARADMLWNPALAVQEPLLSRFPVRALLDVDPGQLQAAALTWELPIAAHEVLFTVGLKLGDADCPAPLLGLDWHTAPPPVHLASWPRQPGPDPSAPFTSVTHWGWGDQDPVLDGRMYSTSKRLAYLRNVGLPMLTGRPFRLAAQIWPNDGTGDLEVLQNHGWDIVDPAAVAGTPHQYQRFIADSTAEICCPKGVYRELRTGWLSDRSACYLASGRPVLCEDTGAGDHLPAGEGLVLFEGAAAAAEEVRRIDCDYRRHSDAARRLAEEHLDSRRVLGAMVDACR